MENKKRKRKKRRREEEEEGGAKKVWISMIFGMDHMDFLWNCMETNILYGTLYRFV